MRRSSTSLEQSRSPLCRGEPTKGGNVDSADTQRAILLGNAVYVLLEAVVLAFAALSGAAGAATWGGVVIDVIFGAASVYFYSRLAG